MDAVDGEWLAPRFELPKAEDKGPCETPGCRGEMGEDRVEL